MCRCLVVVVGGVYLCVMLRVQLNILAGYLHHQETAAASAQHNNNIKSGSISHQMQELFLSVCNNFVTQGVYLQSSICFGRMNLFYSLCRHRAVVLRC